MMLEAVWWWWRRWQS